MDFKFINQKLFAKKFLFSNFFLINFRLHAHIILFIIGISNLLLQTKIFEYCIGGSQDAYFNNLILENFYLNLIGDIASFKNVNFLYPLENNIFLSDNHWVIAIFYAIPRFLGFDLCSSFNLFVLSGFCANYWVCFYVFKRLGFSNSSSALGAYIFSFNQIILNKILHIQLNLKIFIPLAILYAKYYFEKRDFRYISFIVACISFQQVISSYNGFFLALYIMVIFLFFLAKFKIYELNQILPKQYSLTLSIPIIIASIGLLIIISKPYLDTIKMYDIKYFYYPKPEFNYQFLFTLSNSRIWNFITNYFELKIFQDYDENQFFMGFGVIFLILSGISNKNIIKNLSEFDKIIILSTLFILLLFWTSEFSLIVNAIKLYPPFRYLRAHSRFFYVIFFGIVYFAVIIFSYLENNKNIISQSFYYFIILILIIENLSCIILKYKKNNEIENYQNLVAKYDDNQEKIVLFTRSDFYGYVDDQINIVLAFIDNKKIKLINGYSGYNFLHVNLANNCQEAIEIITKNEEIVSKFTNKNFKYDRSKLLVFHDKKLCDIVMSAKNKNNISK